MALALMLRDTPFDPANPGPAGVIFGGYASLRVEVDAVYAPDGPDFALAWLEGGRWTGDIVGHEQYFEHLVVLNDSPSKPLSFQGALAPAAAAYLNLPAAGPRFVGVVRSA